MYFLVHSSQVTFMLFTKVLFFLLSLISVINHSYLNCKLSSKFCYHKLLQAQKIDHSPCHNSSQNQKRACCEKIELNTSNQKLTIFFLNFISTSSFYFINFELFREFDSKYKILIIQIFKLFLTIQILLI